MQEGAAIIAFKLVRDGAFQEAAISELLLAPGKLEGNFGTRNLQDNLSDLKAQVAANQKGANLMHELVRILLYVDDDLLNVDLISEWNFFNVCSMLW